MDGDQANGIKPGSAAVLRTTVYHDLQQALRGDWARFQKAMEEVLRAHVERQDVLLRRQEQVAERLAERIDKVATPCSGVRGCASSTRLRAAGHDASAYIDRETTFQSVLPVEASTCKSVLQPCSPCLGPSAPVVALGCGVPSAPAWSRCWPSKPPRPPFRRPHSDVSCRSPPVTTASGASDQFDEVLLEAALSMNSRSPTDATDAQASSRKRPALASGQHSSAPPLRRGFTAVDKLFEARQKDAEAKAKAQEPACSSDPLQYINHNLTGGWMPTANHSTSDMHDRTGRSSQTRSAEQFHLEMEHGAKIKRTCYMIFSNWIDWWMNLREPERYGWLYRKTNGAAFNSLCALVISLNGIVVALQTNEDMNVDGTVSLWQQYAEMCFLAFYCVEVALKLWLHGMYYFCNSDCMWNLFDFVLVTFSIASVFLTVARVNVSFVRALRIFKMAKVLRMVRVMRFFSELRLILNSLLGSFISLFWSVVMLALIVYIFGLMFVQEAAAFIRAEGDSITPDREENVRKYFGSVQSAMLTLFMAATGGDDWSVFYSEIALSGTMGSVLFLFYIAFIHIAVLNVLTGIFVENAMRLAVPDRDTLALDVRKREITEADELRRICREIDTDHSGTINMEEFKELISSGKVRAHLSLLGLHIKDAEMFLGMLAAASDSHELEIESIVQGCMRMKGNATSLDMQNLVFITKIIHKHQKKFENEVTRKLSKIEEDLLTLVSGLAIGEVDDLDGDGDAFVTDHGRVPGSRAGSDQLI